MHYSLIFILMLASTSFAQTVPIVRDQLVIGGVEGGKWLSAEETAPKIGRTAELRRVELYGITVPQTFVKGDDMGACPEIAMLRPVEGGENFTAVGTGASWSLFPRKPETPDPQNPRYGQIVRDVLRTKGLGGSPVRVGDVVVADLDGDGSKETLIAANYYRRGLMEEQGKGDFSVLILSRTVRGRVVNTVVSGEFFTRKGIYVPPNVREIPLVADLNGDGRMEILLDSRYYEGLSITIYEFRAGKTKKVIDTFCGL